MYGLCVWSWALTPDSSSTLKERARGTPLLNGSSVPPISRKLSSMGEEKVCILQYTD